METGFRLAGSRQRALAGMTCVGYTHPHSEEIGLRSHAWRDTEGRQVGVGYLPGRGTVRNPTYSSQAFHSLWDNLRIPNAAKQS
jgi:hypothetical protein